MLFLVIALLVFITQTLFSYWWLVAIDAFVASLLVGKKAFNAYLSGFFGVALVWFGQIYYINSQNEGLLLGKISKLLGISGELLIIVTLLIIGTVGGLSALSAYYLKSIVKKATH